MVTGPVQGTTLDPWPSAGWCGQPFYFLIFSRAHTHTHTLPPAFRVLVRVCNTGYGGRRKTFLAHAAGH